MSRSYADHSRRGGYVEWVQIVLILSRVELEKSLRETEDYLNEILPSPVKDGCETTQKRAWIPDQLCRTIFTTPSRENINRWETKLYWWSGWPYFSQRSGLALLSDCNWMIQQQFSIEMLAHRNQMNRLLYRLILLQNRTHQNRLLIR